ncbi:hypothetical protein BCR39DRAFT_544522 [Naematelia encephala]|uniref:Alpha and gamma adaptin binding protein p34-domain-containing protein n=1 Tax=Naematelia encephala TaxID=71784 RepID=A0A1Y2AS65_9TREE|nr:hypothetical protein BCR39DRAFT_544522 [Naematelia encephala]
MVDPIDPSQTILVLHDPSLDSQPFLSRLLESPILVVDSLIPWTIDNKYYTSLVHLQIAHTTTDQVDARDIPVVLYLFSGDIPNPLPRLLTQLVVHDPRDIALAVHVGDGEEVLDVSLVEEAFDELGMEVVDEAAVPEEDDERPIAPLEQIRQTLQTHLWPKMIRKPLASSLDTSTPSDDEAEAQEEDEISTSFPTTFRNQENTNFEETEAGPSTPKTTVAFPALEDIRAQLALDQREDFELEEAEYARLDEWLDGDDEGYHGFEMLDDQDAIDGFGSHVEDTNDGDEGGKSQVERGDDGIEENEDGVSGFEDGVPGFEDDFDDFAPFHSAPPPLSSSQPAASLIMDPTPLLLHLQSVRAELAGVEDEDERRVRAAREVGRVMKDLGMEGWDEDDLEADLFADEGEEQGETGNGHGRRGEVLDLII